MLNELCKSIHADNVTAGWWTASKDVPAIKAGDNLVGKRNVPEMLCLIHSEITEAWHGAKNGLYDDKLPERAMTEVEFADTLIRTADLVGSYDCDFEAIVEQAAQEFEFTDIFDGGKCISDLHQIVDNAMEGYRKNLQVNGIPVMLMELGKLYVGIMAIGELMEMDILGAIAEKREYNRTRADHKIENRLKEGGKAF